MANSLYLRFIDKMMAPTGTVGTTSGTSVNLQTDTVRIVLLNTNEGTDVYAPNFVTDEFLSVIPTGARILISDPIGAKSVIGGVFDGDDVLFTSVPSGAYGQIEACALFKDTGNAATSPLILYLDTVQGLPFNPSTSGGGLNLVFDNGPNKILRINRQ